MRSTILSTRPEGAGDPLVERLVGHGYRVLAVPTVATEALDFEAPEIERQDWVVVTSATAVDHLLGLAEAPAGPRWAAVGPRTARALRDRGIVAEAVPEQPRGINVVEAMARITPLSGLRVLLPRADAAGGDLPAALRAGGAITRELPVYRTVEGPEASREPLLRALAETGLAAVVFASGSAVRGLRRLAPGKPPSLPAIAIGPATGAVAREQGFDPVHEASRASVAGLVEAVLRHVG